LSRSEGGRVFLRFFSLLVWVTSLYSTPALIAGEEPNFTTDDLKTLLHGNFCWDMKWEYVGQLQNGYHIIWSCVDEPEYSLSGLHILKVDEPEITLMDMIDGYRCWEVWQHAQIQGNQVLFHRTASEGSLIDWAVYLFPEVKQYDSDACRRKKGIGYGKGGDVGVFVFVAEVNGDGKVGEPALLSFKPAEGWLATKKEYLVNDMKNLALELLNVEGVEDSNECMLAPEGE